MIPHEFVDLILMFGGESVFPRAVEHLIHLEPNLSVVIVVL